MSTEKDMLTQEEAERQILDHYGQKKQELQVVQELSELILLLAARPDQRGHGYERNILSELADVRIMCDQIQMLYEISDDAVEDMIAYKLRRQLSRIEKEAET